MAQHDLSPADREPARFFDYSCWSRYRDASCRRLPMRSHSFGQVTIGVPKFRTTPLVGAYFGRKVVILNCRSQYLI